MVASASQGPAERSTLATGLLVVLLLASGLAGCGESPAAPDPARADDEFTTTTRGTATGPKETAERTGTGPSPATKPSATPACLPWSHELSRGLRLARETGRLLLLYVCPSATSCPAGAELDRRLLTPEATRKLGSRCVPVHVLLDGPSQGDARRLLRRLDFAVTPALAIVSARGDVLHRQYARLYSAYDFEGRVLPGAWDATLGADEIAVLLDDAAVRYAGDRSALRDLRALDTVDSFVREATILERWGRTDEAAAVLQRVVANGPHPEAGPALARLLEREGRLAEAAALFERVSEAHKAGDEGHPDVAYWRSEAARLRLQTAADPTSAAPPLERLHSLAANAPTERVRILSRLSLAEYHHRSGSREALRADRAWLRARVGDGERAPPAWSGEMLQRLIGLHMHPEPDLLDRAERYVQMLFRTHPHSVSAQRAKHGLLGHVRQMGRMVPPQPADSDH